MAIGSMKRGAFVAFDLEYLPLLPFIRRKYAERRLDDIALVVENDSLLFYFPIVYMLRGDDIECLMRSILTCKGFRLDRDNSFAAT